MIKKLFGGKSDGFFLELDETGNNKSTETKVETKATEAAQQPEPVAAATKAAQQPEPAKAESTKKSKKTSIKNKKQKSTKTAATPAPTASPVSSGSASSWEQPFWVKAMYKNNSSSSNGQVGGGEQIFATDNLLPTPSRYRRRPGPSLNKFKEMARQAKTPRR